MEYETHYNSWVVGENAFAVEPDPAYPERFIVRFYRVDFNGVIERDWARTVAVERSAKPRAETYVRPEQVPNAQKAPRWDELQAQNYQKTEIGVSGFIINHAKREAYHIVTYGPEFEYIVPKPDCFYVGDRGWVAEVFPYKKLVTYIEEEEKPRRFKLLPREGRMVAALILSLHDARPKAVLWLNPKRMEDEKYYRRDYWVKLSKGSDTEPPIPFGEIHNAWKIEVPEWYYANEFYVLETDKNWFGIHCEGYFEGYAVSVYQLEKGVLYEVRSKLETKYDPELGVVIKTVGEEKVVAAISEPAAVRAFRLISETLRRVEERGPSSSASLSPPEVEEGSEEWRAYVDLLKVNVVGVPEKRSLPGYVDKAWVIRVIDEGTGEEVPIVYPFPTYDRALYEMETITNKEGKPVTVLMAREEKAKIEVPRAKPEEIEEAIEAVEREVPERVVTAPIDWTWMRGIATRMETWLKSMEHQADVRNALALYTYLKSINEWMEDAKQRLLAGSEFLRLHEARKVEPVYRILTDEEHGDLWRKFSDTLRKAKKDPAKYKERFDELIAWNMPYEDNEFILMDEARGILLENKLKKYIKKLPIKPVPFSWKHIQWGLGSLRIDIGVFKDAVKQENALQSYATAIKIADTAERMKKLLETTPEVRAFRGGVP